MILSEFRSCEYFE